MEQTSTRGRVAEMRVKLTPELLQQFGRIAQGRGVPPSTLAALVVGEYVEKQEEQRRINGMVAVDVARRMVEVSMTDDKLERMVAASLTPENMAGLAGIFQQQLSESEAGRTGSSTGPEAAAPSIGAADEGDRVRTAT